MVMVLKIKLMLSILLMMFSFCLTTISAKEKKEYIVIDPGHGGMDPGCNIGDIKESDIEVLKEWRVSPSTWGQTE